MKRRRRKQNEVLPSAQPANDFNSSLFPGEFSEELFDVLDFERALLELVLSDVMFHG